MEKVTSYIPFRKKYTFLWFKKTLLFPVEGKYKLIIPKDMLSSSLADIIFLCTFFSKLMTKVMFILSSISGSLEFDQ